MKHSRQYLKERTKLKNKRLRNIIDSNSNYNPLFRPYIEFDYINGKWTPIGQYIKYSSSCRNSRKYFKKVSNRKIRHMKYKNFSKGNQYHKEFDYW